MEVCLTYVPKFTLSLYTSGAYNLCYFDNGSQVGDDVQDLVAAWKGAALKTTLLSTFATLLCLVAAYRGLGN